MLARATPARLTRPSTGAAGASAGVPPRVRPTSRMPAATTRRTPTAAPAAPTVPTAPAGLARALLGYVVVVVLVVTLAPFELAMPVAVRARLGAWSALDVAANVLLLVPAGFLCALAARRRAPRAADGLLVGAALSVAVETAQLFMPLRYPSLLDVLANGAGGWLGAALAVHLRRRLDPAALVGRLALELPLVGAAYLLVPLGALGAVVAASTPAALHPARAGALLALALFGGSVLGAVQRRHLAPAGLGTTGGMALTAGAGCLVALGPALPAHPRAVLLAAAAAAAFTAARAAAPLTGAEDRRFELDTLRRASPFFAAYLLLLALEDPVAADTLQRAAILRQLELLGAFTLLGYLVAESLGRHELRLRHVAPAVVLASTLLAAATLVLHAAAPPPVASTWLLPAAALPALYGARLYHVQRAAIRRAVTSDE